MNHSTKAISNLINRRTVSATEREGLTPTDIAMLAFAQYIVPSEEELNRLDPEIRKSLEKLLLQPSVITSPHADANCQPD